MIMVYGRMKYGRKQHIWRVRVVVDDMIWYQTLCRYSGYVREVHRSNAPRLNVCADCVKVKDEWAQTE